jgi:hypothetical protein
VNLQLKTTAAQAKSLRHKLERCHAACREISQRGFMVGLKRQYDPHNLLYAGTRRVFDLTAQTAVRCITKVAEKTTGRAQSEALSTRPIAKPKRRSPARLAAIPPPPIAQPPGNLRVAGAAGNPALSSKPSGQGKAPPLHGEDWSQSDPPSPRPKQGVHRFGGQ